MDSRIAEVAQHVLRGGRIDRHEAERLAAADRQRLDDLFYWANRIRIGVYGPTIRLCAIVAPKVGACSEDCAFCAQSARFATGVQRRELDGRQIAEAVRAAADLGAGSVGLVNSGRGPTAADVTRLTDAVAELRGTQPAALCASLGLLRPSEARALRDAGIVRYNHNIETSRRMFERIVTTHRYDDRLATLRIAHDAGLELCCGGIFGLGETWADRLDLAFELRELGPQVVPLNFLHAIPGTPLAGVEPLEPMEVLRIIAVFRFVLPDADIKVAGGREASLRDLQSWIFRAGASSTMIGHYLTTSGRSAASDGQMIRDLGLTCATSGSADSG